MITASYYSGSVRLWDTTQFTPVATLNGVHTVTSVAISPDKSLIAFGRLSGRIHLWSLPQKKQVVAPKQHTGRIINLSFSPDGRLLLSSDELGQVLLWRVQQADLFPVGVYMASYKVGAIHWQDSRHVILADLGGTHYRPHFHHLALEGFTEVEP